MKGMHLIIAHLVSLGTSDRLLLKTTDLFSHTQMMDTNVKSSQVSCNNHCTCMLYLPPWGFRLWSASMAT